MQGDGTLSLIHHEIKPIPNDSVSKVMQFNKMAHLAYCSLSEVINWGLSKRATIHQVTTMLATSKNVPFPGHNHLLTTSTDGPTL